MNYYSEFQNCHLKVLDTVKQALYSRHPDIFERLDFADDTIYAEPLLFSYLNQADNKWLDCIIYGYEKEKKEKIYVFSNAEGVVYIPNLGYFLTCLPNQQLILNSSGEAMILECEGQLIEYGFEALSFTDFGIEMVKYQHPLFEPLFTEGEPADYQPVVSGLHKKHLQSINKSLQIIKDCHPALFTLLQCCLKKIMLFNARHPNSFATLSAHNMVFLNVNSWDREFFFVDHLSHEGSHVIFFTLTFESKFELFNCAFDTPVTAFKDIPLRQGTIYLRFHGLFTFMEMTKTLNFCMNSHYGHDDTIHEIRGRFIFHMQRFKLMIDIFERLDIFKKEGWSWFEMFKKNYALLLPAFKELENRYSVRDQPYDFNYAIFAGANNLVV